MDSLAAWLVVPLAGPIADSHRLVIQPVPEQRQSRRYAPCLAHTQKNRAQARFGDFITVCANLALEKAFRELLASALLVQRR
jgi:hypothetical protein